MYILRLPEYKDSFMNIKFDVCKCIRMYEKAPLRSDFRKKIYPWLGLEPTKVLLWWRVKIQNARLL